MPNIIQTRVDARLIHGQASMWMKTNGCNLVLLSDDEAANNEMQQTLMDTTVPDGVESRYFSIQKTIDVINNAAPEQKIYLVVRNIENLYKLIEGGVPIKEINIGNVHQTEATRKYTSHINLNEKEEKIILDLSKKGMTFSTNIMPGIEKGKINLVNEIKNNI